MTINFDLLRLALSDSPDIKKIGAYWIGPCPFCGGDDRFNLKRTNEVDLWICRVCGDGKYKNAVSYLMVRNDWTYQEAIDYIKGNSSANIGVARKVEVEKQSQDRSDRLDAKLKKYTTQEIWEALHRRMVQDESHRAWWRSQGVPDSWQDYLSLGWTPEKQYISASDGVLHSSDAYTIPYFADHRAFRTMQYRINHPVSPKDRYRFEYDLDTTFYRTTPTLEITDKVIVCEGAKKGIVTRTMIKDFDITVLSIPGKMDFGGIEDAIKQCKKIWIVLDPDAEDRAEILASNVGTAGTVVVSMPIKLDDAFLSRALTPDQFYSILRQGVKTI